MNYEIFILPIPSGVSLINLWELVLLLRSVVCWLTLPLSGCPGRCALKQSFLLLKISTYFKELTLILLNWEHSWQQLWGRSVQYILSCRSCGLLASCLAITSQSTKKTAGFVNLSYLIAQLLPDFTKLILKRTVASLYSWRILSCHFYSYAAKLTCSQFFLTFVLSQ